jgi:hypothetical protein
MLSKQTRKGQLRRRAEAACVHTARPWSYAHSWEDGYRVALKDVRKAVGKAGIPSKLVKLLAPMR